MGWERRKRGPASGYYYLSVRVAGRVQKTYFGRQAAGHEAAAEVERRRQGRREAQEILRADRDCTDEADRLAAELAAWAKPLAAAWLILTGHHKRRGQWRRNKHG